MDSTSDESDYSSSTRKNKLDKLASYCPQPESSNGTNIVHKLFNREVSLSHWNGNVWAWAMYEIYCCLPIIQRIVQRLSIRINGPVRHKSMLFHLQIFGRTSRKKYENHRRMFERIPPRLRFCLMDIVPMTSLRDHVFMGFSQCGQYLLSFTYNYTTLVNFRESSKFT